MPHRFDQVIAELRAADLTPAQRLEQLAGAVQQMALELKHIAAQITEQETEAHD